MITAMSFAKLAECYRTQCDNWNGESFQVHTKIGIVKFGKSEEGLHCHEFSPEFIKGLQKNKMQPLGTVEENAEGHTNQQQEQAKEAKKPHHIIGAPTVKNFKCMIKSNQI